MSFVISLCHFCDQHGPSVLQTCYSSSQDEELVNSNETSCQACCMGERYISTDRMTGTRYVSCRLPAQRQSLVSWLSHVCVRSLSCEVNPCVFCEPPSCALSISFSVRDAQARGFYHWLSIVISSRDLTFLASCWPFLSKQVQHIVTWLQDRAVQVYNVERPFRDSKPSQSRPLPQLVKYKAVYARLHCWFAWMIHACNSRLSEAIPRSPYYRLQAQHVFEEGSLKSLRVFLGAQVFDLAALHIIEGRQVIVRGDIPDLVKATVTTFKELLPSDWCRTLPDCDEYLEPGECGLLGVSTQVAVLYLNFAGATAKTLPDCDEYLEPGECGLLGVSTQELLPSDWCRTLPDCDEYLEPGECGLLGVSTQELLPSDWCRTLPDCDEYLEPGECGLLGVSTQELLPSDWCRTLPDCDEYLEPGECGLLGVSTQVAVPCPCHNIVRVDMVQGCVSAKTTAIMPAKYPTLLSKILKALACELLRGKALTYHLQSYRQEWMHIAKLVHLTRMENAASLLVALGVKPQDHQLVSYWSNNLCKS
ncbi:folliculin-like [Macrosteles quadrilineatus]|uniref:folliculin-like n=1 Tax=Macrosteles quadrilineatus TaxID=74068 RepID=UPI0023E2AC9F|nr:folliculin-like [Macrosteles quadrilineatus]